jgi:hypothetical protein
LKNIGENVVELLDRYRTPDGLSRTLGFAPGPGGAVLVLSSSGAGVGGGTKNCETCDAVTEGNSTDPATELSRDNPPYSFIPYVLLSSVIWFSLK